MRKFLTLVLAVALIISTSAVFAADNEPAVFLNGKQMEFDVNPYIENDRTLVPMRAIFEAVGATIEWDDEQDTVYAIRETEEGMSFVVLQIGNDSAFVNGEKMTLDVPAVIKNDRTFVPLRFVIESLGEKVEWDGENYAVRITAE